MTAEDPKIASEQGRRTGEHPRRNCEDKPCPASISFIVWRGIKIRNAELSEFAVPNIVSIDNIFSFKVSPMLPAAAERAWRRHRNGWRVHALIAALAG